MLTRGLISMSRQELHRLNVIERVLKKELKQAQAGKLLKLSTRQIKRLCRKYRDEQACGLVSKKRGKGSNHQIAQGLKQSVMTLAHTAYKGFGPTFMAEKLLEHHQLKVSKETLRQWLIKENLWRAKRSLTPMVHPTRTRRACRGELIQIDGSPHDWFEGRGPTCCLIVFIDDATSEILYLRLEEAETTQAYFRGLAYCMAYYGIPAAFYSDRHSIFRVNQSKQVQVGKTQFERACEALGIVCIHALSPQAKGRVERSNKTHQDRLVKELRLRHISDLNNANAYLEEYRHAHNQRFAKTPAQPQSLFSVNTFTAEELSLILSVQVQRKLSKNLEIRFNNQIYQIQGEGKGRRLQHASITICQTLDNHIYLLTENNKRLAYNVLDPEQIRTEIADEKTLNNVLTKKLAAKSIKKPAATHPWFHSPVSKKAGLSHQRYLAVKSRSSYSQR